MFVYELTGYGFESSCSHDDLAYSFRLFNRLGVTQALSTVREKQKVSVKGRDLQKKIDDMSPATW